MYWLINIPDLTIQGMRAVKIYNLFQVFYFHFMCLPLFRRSDLGEYLKMNVEDTQKSHYTLSYLEFPLCSPHGFLFEFTVVLWSWEERFQNTLKTPQQMQIWASCLVVIHVKENPNHHKQQMGSKTEALTYKKSAEKIGKNRNSTKHCYLFICENFQTCRNEVSWDVFIF